MPATFKLYRNLDALYDVLGSVVESAGAFGSKDDFQALANDLTSFEGTRKQIAERLENLAASKEQEIVRLRAELKTAQAAIPAAPPKKVVVDDTEPAEKAGGEEEEAGREETGDAAEYRARDYAAADSSGRSLSNRRLRVQVFIGPMSRRSRHESVNLPSASRFHLRIHIREPGMSPHGSILAAIFGIVIIGVVLLDAFETVVLPRRVTRHFKLTAWFYRRTWIPWRGIARRIRTFSRQQSFLGYFGPLSLITLLVFWAASLILGFALVQYGIGEHEQLSGEPITFGRIVYHSGQTFFTLGYGDILPTSTLARALFGVRSGHGLRISGGGDRLPAGGVRFVFPARDSDFDAGCARRISADCQRVTGPAGREFRESGDRPDWFSMEFCATGSAGRASCWRARFLIRC